MSPMMSSFCTGDVVPMPTLELPASTYNVPSSMFIAVALIPWDTFSKVTLVHTPEITTLPAMFNPPLEVKSVFAFPMFRRRLLFRSMLATAVPLMKSVMFER